MESSAVREYIIDVFNLTSYLPAIVFALSMALLASSTFSGISAFKGRFLGISIT
jgi:hypothetical protein